MRKNKRKVNKYFKNLKGVSDIVNAMILGLKKEWVKVDMSTFGRIENGVLFGCAATNALCEIMKEPFLKGFLESCNTRAYQLDMDLSDHEIVECSLNYLRMGSFRDFIKKLLLVNYLFPFKIPEFSELKDINSKCYLPYLDNVDYSKNLEEYEKLRDLLIQKEKTFIFRFKNWKYNVLRKIGIK